MVIYFRSNVVSPAALVYMGVDKHENEELIRWGWPEDVWFHVDKLSSAHVYVRLKPGEALDDISGALVQDLAQLVKANSIQGNKMNDVDVVYTMWENLQKTGDMAVGQVGFKRQKEVRKVRVEKRLNEIVNRLNKTREEKTIDYRQEREERDRKESEDKKRILREQKKLQEEEATKREAEKQLRSYDNLFTDDKMKNNRDDGNDSDEFM